MRMHGPGWRKMTWVVVIWNVLMLVWIISGAASGNSASCSGLSQAACNSAQDVGKGIGVAIIIVIWVIGDILLGVLWLVTGRNGRTCPACGRNVKKGHTKCAGCGHNFATPEEFERQKERVLPARGGTPERSNADAVGLRLPDATVTMWCDSCNKEIRGSVKFCPQCGGAAEEVNPWECLECRGPIELEDKFCPSCGSAT